MLSLSLHIWKLPDWETVTQTANQSTDERKLKFPILPNSIYSSNHEGKIHYFQKAVPDQ